MSNEVSIPQEEIDQLMDAMKRLEPYVDHRNDCTTRTGTGPERDYCTCQVDEVVEEVQEALSKFE